MEYHLHYKFPASTLSSSQFHALTKNGPFLDAHLGGLNAKNPPGQTFYTRPLSTVYSSCENELKEGCGCGGKGEGQLKITVKDCIPYVHAQSNEVTDEIKTSGYIKIYPFKWEGDTAKVIPHQMVEVNLKIKNYTELPLQAFHIHDGVIKGGLTGFGPISYFIYTSSAWQRRFNLSAESQKYTKTHSKMLPPYTNTAINDNKTLLDYCKSIDVKKIK
jgi:hypothetical protein